jgi:transposase
MDFRERLGVGAAADEGLAAVAHHADRERVPFGDRDHGVDLLHLAAQHMGSAAWTGRLRDGQVEDPWRGEGLRHRRAQGCWQQPAEGVENLGALRGVVRLAAQLMAGARRGARTRGKSDPIDALAVARAALREGVDNLPTVRLAGPEREIRRLALYRERLVDMRTRLSNERRWQLHDLGLDWEIPTKAFAQPGWQTKINARLARAEQNSQARVARDMIRRISELTRSAKDLYDQIAALVKMVAPQLLAEPGIGVLLAARFISEIAGIDRFTTDAQLARLAGCAPDPRL